MASSRSSTLISLPCLEFGGRGFFRADEETSPVSRLRSSSGSDISCDVRGDSGWGSCIASNRDCLDTEDASVLLPPSPNACVTWSCEADGGVDVPSPALPVINSLLKASTSIDARPGLETFVGGTVGISR